MDRPRFTKLFSRQRPKSVDGKKNPKKEDSALGAHELFLEYEGLLPPSNALSPRRPPTPEPEVAEQQIPHLRQGSGVLVLENIPGRSISTSHRPRQSFSGLSQASTIAHSLARSATSRRKKIFVSVKESVNDGVPPYPDSTPKGVQVSATDRDYTPPSTSYGWLRRRVSSTLRLHSRPSTASTLLPGPREPSFGHLSAPVPDFGDVPGFGYEQPRPRGDLSSGAAARAAAAAQNEILESMRKMRLVEPKIVRDSESGIGIERGDNMTDPTILVVRQDPIRVLPPELIAHVLSYLDAGSLLNAELVSRHWNDIAGSHHIWKQVFRDEYQDTVPSQSYGQGPYKRVQNQDWKSMWRTRKALNQRWLDGHAAAIYLEGHTDSVYCVQFDKDKIFTGSRDRTVRIWNAHTYECMKIIGTPSRGNSPASPPLLPRFTTSAKDNPRPFEKVFIRGMPGSPSSPMSPFYHTGSILCLQFDDRIMVTGSSDCTLIIWDVQKDYVPLQRLRHHTAGVLDVCFDEKHIVSCSKDTTVCLWDRKTGNFLRKMTGHRGPVNAVQLRGNLVVSASGDGVAKLWNLTSGLCIKEFPSKNRGMACVEFSPDSRTILAGGNDQVIYQFDTNTGELVRELKGHIDLVRSLHLDSRNGRIVSGSYDNSVKAFDARTGETIVSLTKWTASWILSAKADYRRIIATSQDSRAVIMDFGYKLPGIELLEK